MNWYVIVETFNGGGHVSNVSVEKMTADEAHQEWLGGKLTFGPYFTKAGADFFASHGFEMSEGQIQVGNLPVKKAKVQDEDVVYIRTLATTLVMSWLWWDLWQKPQVVETFLLSAINKIKLGDVEAELRRLATIAAHESTAGKSVAGSYFDSAKAAHRHTRQVSGLSPFWKEQILLAKAILPVVEMLSLQFEGEAFAEMLGLFRREVVFYSAHRGQAERDRSDVVLKNSYNS